MLKTLKAFNKELPEIISEMRYNVLNIPEEEQATFHNLNTVVELSKPIKIFTENIIPTEPMKLVDCKSHFEMTFPYFEAEFRRNKVYKDNLCWFVDKHSILYVERPFKNRVVKVLTKLFADSNNECKFFGNDLVIQDKKIGPTLSTFNLRSNGALPKNTCVCYLLRWDRPELLDEIFAGDPNHEKRKKNPKRAQIGCLQEFLPDMTREEFIKLLEAEETEDESN